MLETVLGALNSALVTTDRKQSLRILLRKCHVDPARLMLFCHLHFTGKETEGQSESGVPPAMLICREQKCSCQRNGQENGGQVFGSKPHAHTSIISLSDQDH